MSVTAILNLMKRKSDLPGQTRFAETLGANRITVAIEIVVVFAPLYLALALSSRVASSIAVGEQLAILGSPVLYAGVGVTLLFLWIASALRGAGWSEIGANRPRNWLLTIATAPAIAAVVIGAVVLIINPFIRTLGLPARNMSQFEILEGNLPTLLINLPLMWITAGFVEEVLWRGYLMNRLADLFRYDKGMVWVGVVIMSSIIFGLGHAYQGLAGVIKTAAIGAVFGIASLVVGRNVWSLVIAHAAIDTFDFINHYFGG